MSYGLTTTFQFLQRTRNEAAVQLLVAALNSTYAPIRSEALQVLAARPDSAGHEALLNHATRLDESELSALRKCPHQMHDSLAAGIQSNDDSTCANATRILLVLAEYRLFPALIQAVERPDNPQQFRVAKALIRMAIMLDEEAHAPPSTRRLRDPYFARREVLRELTRSLDRFEQHQRREVVEAFLVIVPHDHATLLNLVTDPFHPCHGELFNLLRTSPAPGVMRLLLESLKDQRTPQKILELIAERVDRCFVNYVLTSIGSPVSLRVLRNLERLRHVQWLEDDRDVVIGLDGLAQAAAVELAMASGLARAEVFTLLADVLRQGQREGRRASCQALSSFRHEQARKLIRNALHDPDAQVQALAASQVRQRGLQDTQQRLETLLEPGRDEVRHAAGSALENYDFVSYISGFAEMSNDDRRAQGEIVGKTDPTAAIQLRKKFWAPSPTQRKRAIEMAVAMRLLPAVNDLLAELLANQNEIVTLRVAAAAALAGCDSATTRQALAAAANDANPNIREAALAALESISGGRSRPHVEVQPGRDDG